MTIKKSQGKFFNQVGVFLESQVFTHGQLCVALSRGKYPDKIRYSQDQMFVMLFIQKFLFKNAQDATLQLSCLSFILNSYH
jgi:hypothetical protein